eukprot:535672-Karenia_brevis.AAC.1
MGFIVALAPTRDQCGVEITCNSAPSFARALATASAIAFNAAGSGGAAAASPSALSGLGGKCISSESSSMPPVSNSVTSLLDAGSSADVSVALFVAATSPKFVGNVDEAGCPCT